MQNNRELWLYIKSFTNKRVVSLFLFREYHERDIKWNSIFSSKRCHSYFVYAQNNTLKIKYNYKYRAAFFLCYTYLLLRPYIYFSRVYLFLSQMRTTTITQIKCYVKSKIWQIIAMVTYRIRRQNDCGFQSVNWLPFLKRDIV